MKYAFISYRRKDSRWAAMLLYRRIIEEFGTSAAFLDTDKILPGNAWPEEIRNVLESASLVLLLVGDEWEEFFRKTGGNKLQDDWVYHELRTATEKGIKVLPVFLDRSATFNSQDLPQEIVKLWPHKIQWLEVRLSHLEADLQTLIAILKDSEKFVKVSNSYIETHQIGAPKIWLKCNHSLPHIEFGDIWHSNHRTSQAFLKNVLLEHFCIDNVKFIQQVKEDSASLNFRVSRGRLDPPILLRIHKRLHSPNAVAAIIQLQNAIAQRFEERGLFLECIDGLRQAVTGNDGPVTLPRSEEIINLFSQRDRHRLRERDYFHFEARFFIDNVRHFPAANLHQIRSVAHRLGDLNTILKELDEERRLIEDLAPFRGKLFDLSKSEIDLFENSVARHRYSDSEWMRCIAQEKYVKGVFPLICEQVRWGMLRDRPLDAPALQDFHPHNCFFRTKDQAGLWDECVLIYDFEAIGFGWPREASLAFAIHRFTREFKRGNQKEERALQRAVEAFVDGYTQSGAELPDFSSGILAKWIGIISMTKLIALYNEEQTGHGRNPRKPTTIHDEAMKFLSFIEEAEYYKNIV